VIALREVSIIALREVSIIALREVSIIALREVSIIALREVSDGYYTIPQVGTTAPDGRRQLPKGKER